MKISQETYFSYDEVICPCGCGLYDLQPEFLRLLQSARVIAGIPFVITSWFRCASYNKKIGGVYHSSHLFGYAADISVENSSHRLVIVNALIKVGFSIIRIYRKHIHVALDKSIIDKRPLLQWAEYKQK